MHYYGLPTCVANNFQLHLHLMSSLSAETLHWPSSDMDSVPFHLSSRTRCCLTIRKWRLDYTVMYRISCVLWWLFSSLISLLLKLP